MRYFFLGENIVQNEGRFFRCFLTKTGEPTGTEDENIKKKKTMEMGNSLSLKNQGPRNFLLLLPLPKHLYILYIHHQSYSACSESACTRDWMKPKPRINIIMWGFMGSRLTSSTRCMSTSTKALSRFGWWDRVSPAAKDPITGVTEAFLADTNPNKINLGVVHFFLL